MSEIAKRVSRDLEKIIIRCLRKERERRLQHMDDVKNLLEELKEECDSGRLAGEAAAPAEPRQRFPIVAAALIVTAAIGAGLAWWWTSRTPTAQRQLVLTRLTSDSGLTSDPALSADGKLLAYASDRAGQGNLDIWVRQVAGGEPIRLTTDRADEHSPAFSPDGSMTRIRRR